MSTIMERRQFMRRVVQTAAAASVSAACPQPIFGANERVNIGLIGCGTRGMAVARLMRQVPSVAFIATCDVYKPHSEKAREWAGGHCQAYGDFRKVLDRKDIDA